MQYNNIIPNYPGNMYLDNSVRQAPRPRPGFGPGSRPGFGNNRLIGPGGGFLLPFALGFVSSPLIFGATRPRPFYGPVYGPGYYPYY